MSSLGRGKYQAWNTEQCEGWKITYNLKIFLPSTGSSPPSHSYYHSINTYMGSIPIWLVTLIAPKEGPHSENIREIYCPDQNINSALLEYILCMKYKLFIQALVHLTNLWNS